MKTNVAETSLEAYRSLSLPAISRQGQIVVDAIERQGPMTREEIAKTTGLRLSAVCGRVNELLGTHLVERGERRSESSKKMCKLVAIPDGPAQKELFS